MHDEFKFWLLLLTVITVGALYVNVLRDITTRRMLILGSPRTLREQKQGAQKLEAAKYELLMTHAAVSSNPIYGRDKPRNGRKNGRNSHESGM
jgi:hypothetical protein